MAKPDGAPAGDKKPSGVLPRLNFALERTGDKIAYDALQPKTKERLRKVLTDPELAARLELSGPVVTPGAAGAAAGAESTAWDGDTVALIYNLASYAMVGLAQRAGYGQEAAAGMAFTPDQRDQLLKPTQRLLDKYFPGGLGRYGDELALGVMLTQMIAGKVMTLRATKSTPAEVLNFPSKDAPTTPDGGAVKAQT